MTLPRAHLIDDKQPGFYHLISRCVRRAWLCGEDPVTGMNFDHRQQWIEDRMLFLAECFAVELYAYAVMSNHYHLVVRVDPLAPETWSDEEVAKRWTRCLFGDDAEQEPRRAAYQSALLLDRERLATCRTRLGSLSWFMRFMNERIARAANREDDVKGRFWEGRFKSIALLDERAVLACMAYVDLNPVRAGIVSNPVEAKHTSLCRRAKRSETPRQSKIRPVSAGLGRSVETLPISESDYRDLVMWTAGLARNERSGPNIAGIAPDGEWLADVMKNHRYDRRVMGSLSSAADYIAGIGQKCLRGYVMR